MKDVNNNDVAKEIQDSEAKKIEKDRKKFFEHLGHLNKKKSVVIQKISPIWEGAAVPKVDGTLYDFEYLHLLKLWTQYGIRGQGVNVYVIDSGVDTSHPSFIHHGSSLVSASFLGGQTSGVDGNGHGTWVCGKIGGQGIGIAPRCKLHSLRTLDDAGTGSAEFTTAALKWVLKQEDAHLVNMSLGSFQPSAEQEKILDQLRKAGVLVVAAAGNANTNQPFYPAYYEGLLAVSAIDRREVKAEFSNYGGHIDISAPGVACYGPYLKGTFRKLSGTSMATPIVTGLLTLGLSYLKIRHPDMARIDLRDAALQALLSSAKDLGPAGRDVFFGFGGLNGPAFFDLLSKV